jgi:hypothetical protein
MNDETTTLDRADEDILTYTASDEALEGAAADAHLQAQNVFSGTSLCGFRWVCTPCPRPESRSGTKK